MSDDFFDVPSFDGKGLYKAADDAAWRQTSDAAQKKKNKKKKPTTPGDGEERAGGSGPGKGGRDGSSVKGTKDSGTKAGKGRAGAEDGTKAPAMEKSKDAGRPPGKNLGKRRRAKEKKMRLKELAGDGGDAPSEPAEEARPTKRKKKSAEKEAAAAPPVVAQASPPKKSLKDKRKERKALAMEQAAAAPTAAAAAAAVTPSAEQRKRAALPSSTPKREAVPSASPGGAKGAGSGRKRKAAAVLEEVAPPQSPDGVAAAPARTPKTAAKSPGVPPASAGVQGKAAKAASPGAKAPQPAEVATAAGAAAVGPASAQKSAQKGKKGAGSLLEKAQKQLSGGQFRWLNEELYTRSGASAVELFRSGPELFEAYHEGFQSQTRSWPKQPLDVAIKWLRAKAKRVRVADFGCGEARLAATLGEQHEVHSFDLVATAPGVVACNMSEVPLADGSVDVAVFCLSLMGTDYGAGLGEAHRVLAPGGTLWVAEVRSRFEGLPNAVVQFIAALSALGFKLQSRDDADKMFVIFVFVKTKVGESAAAGKGKQQRGGQPAWPQLKACEYKRR